jgi:hypothetical protein
VTGSKPARAALLVLTLAAAGAGRVRAQGVVLSPEGKPLPVRRVRALLAFQERGSLSYVANQPNRQDLLVQLELAAPAPKDSVWVLACPAESSSARWGNAAVLDEVGAYWRAGAGAEAGEPWPADGTRPGTTSLSVHGPLDADEAAELLAARGVKPEGIAARLPRRRGDLEWTCFVAEVPAEATRVGPARLTFQSLSAIYPGAIGAVEVEEGTWSLAPLELMVLHSHFINVDDNPWGLEAGLGLLERYRDPGTLKKGSPLWDAEDPKYHGGKYGPPRIRPDAGDMPATARFAESCGAEFDLFLTVVEGRAARPRRAELDFRVYSHYPSAVEPVGQPTAFIVLAASLVVMVLLTGFLLKRKGFVDDLTE